MKWLHLATAPDQLEAEMWVNLLAQEGISAIVKPGDATSFLGVSTYPCRILVAEDQLDRAKKMVGTHLPE